MPGGETKKSRKEVLAAAAADYASASPSEMKAKKQQKKRACPELAAAATTVRADYNSAALSKKMKSKEKVVAAGLASPSLLPKKKMKKAKGGNQEEEKSQIKKISNRSKTKGDKIPNGNETEKTKEEIEESDEEKIPSGNETKKMKEDNQEEEIEESDEEKIPNGSEVQSSSLYLVVRHAFECPAYSLYRLKNLLVSADHPKPVPCRIKYLDAERDMSFGTVNSQRRSWIVGVGGFPDHHPLHGSRGETIVFDCKTGLVAKGPRPTASKSEPVLFVIGEKVYALARMPNIWRQPDFPPWFEVLDVSEASFMDRQLTGCTWFPLPSPPLFPIMNNEGKRIDSGPPLVEVESYAVVDHYILLSIVVDPFKDLEAGTVAFDTTTDKWHYVNRQKNLPFIGEAVPYDGLYLGRSKSKEWNDLTAYCIHLTKSKKGTTLNLSIVEIPIRVAMTNSCTVTSGQFFSSLGNGVICAVGCYTEDCTWNEELETDGIYINIHRRVDAEEESKPLGLKEIVLSNNPAMYSFSVQEPIYQLIAPSLVAALRIHM